MDGSSGEQTRKDTADDDDTAPLAKAAPADDDEKEDLESGGGSGSSDDCKELLLSPSSSSRLRRCRWVKRRRRLLWMLLVAALLSLGLGLLLLVARWRRVDRNLPPSAAGWGAGRAGIHIDIFATPTHGAAVATAGPSDSTPLPAEAFSGEVLATSNDESNDESETDASRTERHLARSEARGYMAIVYSGTVRSFAHAFHSHLVNLIAPSPYRVHLFLHTRRAPRSDGNNNVEGVVGGENAHVRLLDSFNATLAYYDRYMNLDGEWVSLLDDCLQSVRIADGDTEWEPSPEFNYTRIKEMVGERIHFSMPIDSLISQHDSIRAANDLRKAKEKQLGIEYAWVAKMRMDVSVFSNVWEDVFDIQPFAPELAAAAASDISKAAAAADTRPDTWPGGALYDMVYSPRAGSMTGSSAQRNLVLFPSCGEWGGGLNDQMALGGSHAMNIYSERVNVKLIEHFLSVPHWRLWAEPYVRHVLDYMGVDHASARFLYGITRTQLKAGTSRESTYFASSCEWTHLKYGEDCFVAACPWWKQRQGEMHASMLELSGDSDETQLALEPYANQGANADQATETYLRTMRRLRGHSAPTLNLASSNYFYFYRDRAAKQLLPCLPPRAAFSGPGIGAHRVDPYLHLYYPFLTRTHSDQLAHRYSQHLSCTQE